MISLLLIFSKIIAFMVLLHPAGLLISSPVCLLPPALLLDTLEYFQRLTG